MFVHLMFPSILLFVIQLVLVFKAMAINNIQISYYLQCIGFDFQSNGSKLYSIVSLLAELEMNMKANRHLTTQHNHSHTIEVPNLKTTHRHKNTFYGCTKIFSWGIELRLRKILPMQYKSLALTWKLPTKKSQLWNIHTQTTWIAVNKIFLQTLPTFKLHVRKKYAFLVNKCFNSKWQICPLKRIGRT